MKAKYLSRLTSPVLGRYIGKLHETMKLLIVAFVGIFLGFFIGLTFPSLAIIKRSSSPDLFYLEGKYNNPPPEELLNAWTALKSTKPCFTPSPRTDAAKVSVPTNPHGAEQLPPGIIQAESDLYLRRLWGQPSEDLIRKPRYLVTFAVGSGQKRNIDAVVRKFSENFTIMLFHYDGRTTEWDEFEWSKRAIHVSAQKQTKWWYAKRFLHPSIVAAYDYIFIWDEDLGVEHFDAEEYLNLVKKYGLEISQPGLEPSKSTVWRMTTKRENSEVHKETDEKNGRCPDPHLPPCAAFVEIMAPVFSREAWQCVWHMIQNDLVHGWGLDFAFRKCVEPAHEKIGVVDAQWIVHQGVPTLGNQGESRDGKNPWEGVRERCRKEWAIFLDRMVMSENAYYKGLGRNPATTTAQEGNLIDGDRR